MSLSESYESTIIGIEVYFGFDQFECEPDDITRTLLVQPDIIQRKGDVLRHVNGKTALSHCSKWLIQSRCISKDVNEHLRELLSRLRSMKVPIPIEYGIPCFQVVWKGNYLYAGSGPFYTNDVLKGIASVGANLYQEIYQVDD